MNKLTTTFTLTFVLFCISAFSQSKLITKIRDLYPSVSPDGKWIAFSSDRSGKLSLYKMDTSGHNIKQITKLDWNEVCPKWSPDGTQIVFAAEPEDGNSEIFIMNSDGFNVKRLTNIRGDDSHPNFSPDGKKIIFNSARTSPDLNVDWGKQYLEIFEMNTDGSDVHQITHNQTISTYPSFSPDGKRILFREVTNEPGYDWDLTLKKRNSEIFLCDADGSNQKNLTNNASFDGWPVWSPDGNYIIFSSNREGPALVGSLFKVKPDGSGLTRITSGNMGYAQPAFSPDGKSVYAYSNVETSAYEYGFISRIAFIQ